MQAILKIIKLLTCLYYNTAEDNHFSAVFLCLLRRGFYVSLEMKKLPPIKVGAVSVLHWATKKDDRFNRHRLIQSPFLFTYALVSNSTEIVVPLFSSLSKVIFP